MTLGEDYNNSEELFDEVHQDDFLLEAEKIAKKKIEEGNSDGYEKDMNEELEIFDSYIYEGD